MANASIVATRARRFAVGWFTCLLLKGGRRPDGMKGLGYELYLQRRDPGENRREGDHHRRDEQHQVHGEEARDIARASSRARGSFTTRRKKFGQVSAWKAALTNSSTLSMTIRSA